VLLNAIVAAVGILSVVMLYDFAEPKNEAILNDEKQMTDPFFREWLIRNLAN